VPPNLAHFLKHLVRIKGVAQAIADVIDRDDGQKNHQPRKDGQPWMLDHVLPGAVEQVAPTRCGGLDAKAQEGKTRFLHDGVPHLQCCFDDNRADCVGQDVASHDTQIRRSQAMGGSDELHLADRQKTGAHKTGNRHPREGADHDGDGQDVVPLEKGQLYLAQDGTQQDQDHEGRKGECRVGDAHENVVDPPPKVSGNGADRDANHECDQDDQESHGQRDAPAIKTTSEQVPAQRIGAEGMLETRRL